MVNEPLPPFEGLNIRIPIITPIKGRGLLITDLDYYPESNFKSR